MPEPWPGKAPSISKAWFRTTKYLPVYHKSFQIHLKAISSLKELISVCWPLSCEILSIYPSGGSGWPSQTQLHPAVFLFFFFFFFFFASSLTSGHFYNHTSIRGWLYGPGWQFLVVRELQLLQGSKTSQNRTNLYFASCGRWAPFLVSLQVFRK